MNPKLSIIIVNFNRHELIVNCIDSLIEGIDCSNEVIIVDNNSTDKSVRNIQDRFPQIKIIANSTNMGFSAGNNIGVNYANGKYLLLINNDALLTTSIMPAIIKFELDSSIGAIGGKIKNDKGEIQPSYGYFLSPINIILSMLTNFGSIQLPKIFKSMETNLLKYSIEKEVDWVSGAFLITRKSLWHKIGGMDERFFMYSEDIDYCREIQNIGYKTIYLNSIGALHNFHNKSANSLSNAFINYTKSTLLYIEKYYNKYWKLFGQYSLGLVYLIRSFIIYIVTSIKPNTEYNKIPWKLYFTTSILLLTNRLK